MHNSMNVNKEITHTQESLNRNLSKEEQDNLRFVVEKYNDILLNEKAEQTSNFGRRLNLGEEFTLLLETIVEHQKSSGEDSNEMLALKRVITEFQSLQNPSLEVLTSYKNMICQAGLDYMKHTKSIVFTREGRERKALVQSMLGKLGVSKYANSHYAFTRDLAENIRSNDSRYVDDNVSDINHPQREYNIKTREENEYIQLMQDGNIAEVIEEDEEASKNLIAEYEGAYVERLKGSVIPKDIRHADIKQNNLGDCYYMAALGKLCGQKPEDIQNFMWEEGDYAVFRFFKEEALTLDEYRQKANTYRIADNFHQLTDKQLTSLLVYDVAEEEKQDAFNFLRETKRDAFENIKNLAKNEKRHEEIICQQAAIQIFFHDLVGGKITRENGYQMQALPKTRQELPERPFMADCRLKGSQAQKEVQLKKWNDSVAWLEELLKQIPQEKNRILADYKILLRKQQENGNAENTFLNNEITIIKEKIDHLPSSEQVIALSALISEIKNEGISADNYQQQFQKIQDFIRDQITNENPEAVALEERIHEAKANLTDCQSEYKQTDDIQIQKKLNCVPKLVEKPFFQKYLKELRLLKDAGQEEVDAKMREMVKKLKTDAEYLAFIESEGPQVQTKNVTNTKPVFVKVKKEIHRKKNGVRIGADGADWVNLAEKAYALSGLSSTDKYDSQTDAFTDNELDKSYQATKKKVKLLKEKDPDFSKKDKVLQELDIRSEALRLIKSRYGYLGNGGFSSDAFKCIMDKRNDVTKKGATTAEDFCFLKNLKNLEQSILDYEVDYNKIFREALKRNPSIYERIEKKKLDVYKRGITIEDIQKNFRQIIDHIENAPQINQLKEAYMSKENLSEEEAMTRIKDVFQLLEQKYQEYFNEDQQDKFFHEGYSSNSASIKYTKKALDIYRQIEQAVNDNKLIACGTEKFLPEGYEDMVGRSAGEQANGGVYEGHAYTILRVDEIKGRKYVILQNPWGACAPKYVKSVDKNGTITTKSVINTTNDINGVGVIELNDFLAKFNLLFGL